MIKYFVQKLYKMDFRHTEEAKEEGPSYTIDGERLCTLYDTKQEAYDRILREILGTIKNDTHKYNLEYNEIISFFMKRNFDFVLEKEDEKLGNSQVHYKKLSDGILNELKTDGFTISSKRIIIPVEKENILYTIASPNTNEDFVLNNFKCGITDKAEEASYVFENYKFWHEKDFVNIFILDKEKIYDDDFLCKQMVSLGFLNGFSPEMKETLKYFNPENVAKNMLEIRCDVVEKINDFNKTMAEKNEEIEKLNKSVEHYKKICNTRAEEIKKLENKIDNIKDVIYD